jgi:hypothetical protein
VKDMASAILILTLIMSLLINITRVDELIGNKQKDELTAKSNETVKAPVLDNSK